MRCWRSSGDLARPQTAELGIGGGRDLPAPPTSKTELVQEFGISVDRAAHLVDAYGTRAREVMAFCAERPDDRPLGVGIELTAAEVAFLTQHEYVTRLGDLIMRRTAVAITGTIDTGLIEADRLRRGRRTRLERRTSSCRDR